MPKGTKLYGDKTKLTDDATEAIAIGAKSIGGAKHSLALGYATNAVNEGDIALGSESETNAITTITSDATAQSLSLTDGSTITYAGIQPKSMLSVGKAGSERSITNVAAGRVTATSTDAINGSQLYAITEDIKKIANAATSGTGSDTITIGKDAIKGDPNTPNAKDKSSIIMSKDEKTGTGKIEVNGSDKDSKVGIDGNTGISVDGKDGKSVAINANDGISVLGPKGKDGNQGKSGVTISGGNGKDGADSVEGKIAIGTPGVDGKPGVDAVSLTSKDGVGHIGLAGKDGVSADISVKKGDPDVNGKEGSSLSRITYEAPELDATGKPVLDEAGKPKTVPHQVATLDDGVKYAGDNVVLTPNGQEPDNIIRRGLNRQIDIVGDIRDDVKETVKDITKIDKAFTTGNIGVFAIPEKDEKGQDTSKLHLKLAKDLEDLSSVLTVDKDGNAVKQDGTGIHLGTMVADTKNKDKKVFASNGPSLTKDSLDMKDKDIVNAKAIQGDTITANSKIIVAPAVNAKGEPINNGKPAIELDGKSGANGKDGGMVAVHSQDGNSGVSIKGNDGNNGGTISIVGKGANGNAAESKIMVANGKLSLMNPTSDGTPGKISAIATVGDIDQLRTETANVLSGINDNIRNVGANAAAMSMLKPLSYDPLEPTQIMAGIGFYQGQQAAALGLAHYSNESTMFHAGVSIGAGNNMVGVGLTRKFGSSADERAVPERYKAGPISSVYVMQDEMNALKAENKSQKEEIEEMRATIAALVQKVGLN